MDYPTVLYKKIIQEIEKKLISRGGIKRLLCLEGCVECLGIVDFGVYDTKLVRFLSMAAEKFVWNINKK